MTPPRLFLWVYNLYLQRSGVCSHRNRHPATYRVKPPPTLRTGNGRIGVWGLLSFSENLKLL